MEKNLVNICYAETVEQTKKVKHFRRHQTNFFFSYARCVICPLVSFSRR